jgi:hypothetical protein
VPVSAGSQIAASAFSGESNATANAGGSVLIAAGGWLNFGAVDFGSRGARSIRIQLISATGKSIRIRVRADSANGPLLATLSPGTGRRALTPHVQTTHAKKLTGVHDVYVQVIGRSGGVTLDWFSFQLLPPKVK